MLRNRPAKVGGRRNAVKSDVDTHLAAQRDEAERVHAAGNRLGGLAMPGVDAAEVVVLQENTCPIGAVSQREVGTIGRKQLLGRDPEVFLSPPLLFDAVAIGLRYDDCEPPAAALAASCAVVTLKARFRH